MKVAVVGTGISGMLAARRLHEKHDITVYESGSYVGGHTNTIDIEGAGGTLAIDTGFIVFNKKTYPNFCNLLTEIGVSYQPSEMSFSVRCDQMNLEYNGTSLNGLFAQRRNVFRPKFWRMAREIVRFYKEAPEVLRGEETSLTLGDFLSRGGYSETFIDKHLVPMSAAIWSARPDLIHQFPLRFLVQFFQNHGFLELKDRPTWQVITGGSRAYVEPMVKPFRDRIQMNTPIVEVRRKEAGVELETVDGKREEFERVVLACHANQSLAMLVDANALEKEVLGAFRYQHNEAVLHTDTTVMPKRRRAWASWNYQVNPSPSARPVVTYWMNELQSLNTRENYFVTLNRSAEIETSQVLKTLQYHHPIYSIEAVRAQNRFEEIDGLNGVHYCGAYWGYGFHEDGVKSGLRVANRVGHEVLSP